MKLTYSVARFVPSLVRGEAINIGVAVEGPEPGSLLVKFSGSLSRARQIFPDADTATVGVLRRHFKELPLDEATSEPVFGYAHAGKVTLSGLVAECRNTMLQFSEPAVTIAENPDAELDDLYETFVAPKAATAARMFGTLQMAPARLRGRLFQKLERAGYIGPRKLHPQFRVKGTVFPWEFDLGHANGGIDIIQSIALAGPEDAAVSRALLLAAQVDDIRAAKVRVGHVIAAADRAEPKSAPVKLLGQHNVEVTEIGKGELLEAVKGLMLEAHGARR